MLKVAVSVVGDRVSESMYCFVFYGQHHIISQESVLCLFCLIFPSRIQLTAILLWIDNTQVKSLNLISTYL